MGWGGRKQPSRKLQERPCWSRGAGPGASSPAREAAVPSLVKAQETAGRGLAILVCSGTLAGHRGDDCGGGQTGAGARRAWWEEPEGTPRLAQAQLQGQQDGFLCSWSLPSENCS